MTRKRLISMQDIIKVFISKVMASYDSCYVELAKRKLNILDGVLAEQANVMVVM